MHIVLQMKVAHLVPLQQPDLVGIAIQQKQSFLLNIFSNIKYKF